jgi:hypothetical protein
MVSREAQKHAKHQSMAAIKLWADVTLSGEDKEERGGPTTVDRRAKQR